MRSFFSRVRSRNIRRVKPVDSRAIGRSTAKRSLMIESLETRHLLAAGSLLPEAVYDPSLQPATTESTTTAYAATAAATRLESSTQAASLIEEHVVEAPLDSALQYAESASAASAATAAGTLSGSNSANVEWTSSNTWVGSSISLAGAPDDAWITGVSLRYNFDGDYLTSNQAQLANWSTGWTSAAWYLQHTGDVFPYDVDNLWDGYAETDEQTRSLTAAGSPNGTWRLSTQDTVDSVNDDWDVGRLDWWEITVNYAYPIYPDLVASSYRFDDAQVVEGDWTSVEWRVTNQGDAEAPASKAKAWLGGSQGSYEHYLGEVDVPSLGAGEDAWVRWDFAMPDLGTGAYPVFSSVQVDSAETVAEADGDGNNWWTIPLSFTAEDPPFMPYFYAADVVDRVDVNGDGFARQFEVRVDVDAGVTAGDVKLKFYKDNAFWFDNPLGVTASFGTQGAAADPHDWVINADQLGLGEEAFDLRIDLVDATDDGIVYQTWTKADVSALGDLRVQPSALDVAFAPNIVSAAVTNPTDQDGDGYAQSLRVEFTVGGNVDGSWYVRLLDGTSTVFTSADIAYDGGSDSRYIEIFVDDRYSPTARQWADFRLEIYDAARNQLTGSYDALPPAAVESSWQDAYSPALGVVSPAMTDADGDGYARSLSFQTEVVSDRPGTFRVELWRDGFWPWQDEKLAETAVVAHDGSGTVLQTISLSGDDAGLSRGLYDFQVRLIHGGTTEQTGTASAEDVAVEPAAADAPFEPYFYDVRVASVDDQDADGYARAIRIEFDVDSNIAGVYRVDVHNSATGARLASSNAYSVEGYAYDWRGVDLPASSFADGPESVDLEVRLIDQGGGPVSVWRSGLEQRRFEPAAYDDPFTPILLAVNLPAEQQIDADGDGYAREYAVDVDVTAAGPEATSGTYFLRFYDRATGNPLATTEPRSLTTGAVDSQRIVFDVESLGLPRGTRGLRVELYKSSAGAPAQWISTWNSDAGSELANIDIEPAADDVPEPGDALVAARLLEPVSLGSLILQAEEQVGDGGFGSADVDLYRLEVVDAGRLVVDVDAAEIGLSSLDGYLRLFDSAGTELAANDDFANTVDPTLSVYVAGGTYYVGVSSRDAKRYASDRAGSANPTDTGGRYELAIELQSATTPWQNAITLGNGLTIDGNFELTTGLVTTATGTIHVNDALRVDGSFSYDDSLNVWGAGRVYADIELGPDVLLFDGSFSWSGGVLAVEQVNGYADQLRAVGMQLRVESVRLAEGGLELRGNVTLPDAAGGIELDINGEQFVRLNLAGDDRLDYDVNVLLAPIDLSFHGLGFRAVNGMVNLTDSGGPDGETVAATITGEYSLSLPPAVDGIAVSLNAAEGNFLRVDEFLNVDFVGSLEVGRVDIAPNLYVDSLVFEFNTLDDRFFGSGRVGLPIGSGVEVEAGVELLAGRLEAIQLAVDELNTVVWSAPPILLQSLSGGVAGLADGPIVISLGAGLSAGPQVGDYALLRLDGNVTADLSGRMSGDVDLRVGDLQAPLAVGEMNLIWDQNLGVYLTGGLSAGPIGDGFLFDLDGSLKLDNQNTFQGRLDGIAAIPESAPIIGRWVGGREATATAYMQFLDDGVTDNDYIIGSIDIDLPLIGRVEHAVELNLHSGEVDFNAGLDRIKEVTFPGLTASPSALLAQTFSADPLAATSELFPVAGGVEWVIFRSGWESGVTELQLIDPLGNFIDPATATAYDNIEYVTNAAAQEAYYIVRAPAAGDWQLSVTDDTGIGEYVLTHFQYSAAPAITVTGPDAPVAGGPVQIDWVAVDSDSEAAVSLYYDTDRAGADGTLIADGFVEGVDTGYSWSTVDVPTGEYYIYAVADDGVHRPAISYSAGRVAIVAADAPPTVTGLTTYGVTPDSVTLRWDAAGGDNPAVNYLIRYTANPASPDYSNSISVTGTELTIAGLQPGITYRFAAATVGADGSVSADSVAIAVTLPGAAESDTEGQRDIYAAPGELLELKATGGAQDLYTAVSLPEGAALSADGVFRWQIPASGASGWHEVEIHVLNSSGSIDVQRFRLLVDESAPGWIGVPTVTPTSGTSVLVSAPLAADVSGGMWYRFRRDDVFVSPWQQSPELEDLGLDPAREYRYEIQARDGSPFARLSEWTAPITVVTPAAVPGPPVFHNLTATSVTVQLLAAAANPSSTAYALRNENTNAYSDGLGGWSAEPIYLTAAEWQGVSITGLSADTRYRFTAIALNGTGAETEGVAAEVVTLPDVTAPQVIASYVDPASRDIVIEFSQPTILTAKDLTLIDSATGAVVDAASAAVQQGPEGRVYTVSFNGQLPDGNYDLMIEAAGVENLAGVRLDGNADGSPGSAFTALLDNLPPTVTGVFVRSSTWTGSFLDALDAAGLGHSDPGLNPRLGYRVGGESTPMLPWTNIDSLILTFSEDIEASTARFAMFGVNQYEYQWDANAFSYDPATRTATFNLPLEGRDRLLFALAGGTEGPVDAAGHHVADDALQRFDFNPGDISRDGRVDALDLLALRAAWRSRAGQAQYTVTADLSGDGRIDALDLLTLKQNYRTRLPADEPPEFLGFTANEAPQESSHWVDYYFAAFAVQQDKNGTTRQEPPEPAVTETDRLKQLGHAGEPS
jgi:hypothetical protein